MFLACCCCVRPLQTPRLQHFTQQSTNTRLEAEFQAKDTTSPNRDEQPLDLEEVTVPGINDERDDDHAELDFPHIVDLARLIRRELEAQGHGRRLAWTHTPGRKQGGPPSAWSLCDQPEVGQEP